MEHLDLLVTHLLDLSVALRTPEQLVLAKRAWAKQHKSAEMPTNVAVLKTYAGLVKQGSIQKAPRFEQLLKKRSIRSESGIVPIQVLTKPFRCPGQCIFCPNDATMPKSYINTQPGAMRALLNQFDPYKQVYNRLLSLTLTGHATDKIEMIVLGGTRDVYPRQYKIDFIKGLYDACNHFAEFLELIEIDFSAPKAPRYTLTEGLHIDYPPSIEASIQRNETAGQRIIGLTIETRPEYVTDENCQFRRELGVTRMEMGIQTLFNSVHDKNKRGHDNDAIVRAMHKLRQYGFKISNHYMPGLYGSTPPMDLETFRVAYEAIAIKSDEMKFYPTAVIPNTGLYDLWKKGEYIPLDPASLQELIRRVKLEIIPPYARIKRLARDFDTNEVVAGANTPNLRQLVMNELQKEFSINEHLRATQYARLAPEIVSVASEHDLYDAIQNITFQTTSASTSEGRHYDKNDEIKTFILHGSFDTTRERGFVCLCTRCREMRNIQRDQGGEKNHQEPFFVVRAYQSSNGKELFCSYEDDLGYVYGFMRLLLPAGGTTLDYPGLGHTTALIRELHVYGTVQSLTTKKNTAQEGVAQHGGFGTQLLYHADQLATRHGYTKLSVISGIGVRQYYVKKGYHLEGTYMVKELGEY